MDTVMSDPMKHEITRADLMPMEEYGKIRRDHARALAEAKKNRRVHIGPDATAYFESYDTMWYQVHEMLWIERGGDEQVADELAAYNPLIPNGAELTCTLMIEIGDADRRAAMLAKMGGFEETITLSFAGHTIKAVPEVDVDRTNADGKASSVQFLHFPFTADQIAAFRTAGTDVTMTIGHPEYRHMAIFPEPVREALSADFD
jgi:hypothetical protein